MVSAFAVEKRISELHKKSFAADRDMAVLFRLTL